MTKHLLTTLLFLISCIFGMNAETFTYSGNIGEYQVKVTLTTKFGSRGMTSPENWDYLTGKYTYLKAGNSLTLKGKCYYGMSQSISLTERTPKGKKSGEWYLEGVPGDEELTGEFTNLSNGKRYNVRLWKH